MNSVHSAPGRIPLLATKLHIPPARANLVARPRLLDPLDRQLDQRLTLISAPAGFGKTTLVSAWVRSLPQPVAWLSLDAADSDPARFLRYIVAALQQIDAAIGQSINAALDASQPPPLAAAIGALINDVSELLGDFLLVLDDFHTIDNAAIHEAMQTLVAHLPPQMHLVIVTREDPPLPLARLRAHGQLVELRAHDLRFTLDEAATFLRDGMGLTLDHADVDALDARVEGWIVGLQLAALSMQKHAQPSEFIAGLADSSRNRFGQFILSYLTEEVLTHLAPDLHDFLLQTAVLDRLTGPLCNAVTGRADSETLLADLEAANIFVIPLDDEARWYRYHHLFAELLRSQLHRAQPDLALILHQRASEWYAGQGLAAEAIDHAFAAQDYDEVVRLLEIYARPVVLQGDAQTVESWLRRLGQVRLTRPAILAGPRANLAFAWSLLLRGQLNEIEPYLRDAEAAGIQHNNAHEAEILSLRAALVSLRGDVDQGCAMAERAVALAADDPYVRGMSLFTLATAYNYAGRIVEAIDRYQQALPIGRTSGNTLASMLIVANLGMLYMTRGQLHAAADLCLPVIIAGEQAAGAPSPALATVYGIHSELLYLWGEWEMAHRELVRWLVLSKRGGHIAAVTYGQVLLSRVRQALGDLRGATAALEEISASHPPRSLSSRMPSWVTSQVTAQQVSLALAQGDVATASAALAQTGVAVEDSLHHSREVIQISYVRLLYHLGRDDAQSPHLTKTLDLSTRLLTAAERAGRMGRLLDLLVQRALIHAAQGNDSLALADLRRALILAAPEGYVTVFVNGAPMQLLLAHLRSRLERQRDPIESRPLIAHIDKILAVFAVPTATLQPPLATRAAPLAEPLSDRELDVLRLMADGLTYQEVADQLIVSLNTVRFHVKSIYGKLGVDKRATAIDRARGLKLI